MQLRAKNISTKKVIAIAAAAIALVVIVAAVVIWQLLGRTGQSNESAEALRSRLVSKIGQYLELPTDEHPTVARIKDKTQVEKQPFFKHAQDGDYLIVYENEGTAILYREQTNKLIKVGTITVREAQQAPLVPGQTP